MNRRRQEPLLASCLCGQVAFEMAGPPILSVACYCKSCQDAGRQIEALAEAPPVLRADAGTDFVMHRKDRVRCVRGGERLEALRLTPASTTRRLVAKCCNAPMALEFKGGHWLSVYRDRLAEGAPPLDERTMAAERPEGVELLGDIPSYSGHSGRFMWRLMKAWAAMGFRNPKVEGLPA
ncbi:MAG: DUF6151 family protein [Phenylobacterium sp.]|uniref:GFA family protein n=1 Tax=Phenylobacterium sp. TaxID=1871053 RepID=UPI0027341D7C|nr:DUF6151 family protein [Phenylobacterium sp.]MDP3748645.1 DUF6151 family protein [Phenylobacterium sp.]